ncbi:MAG: helicase-related protein [Granulosicoccus sp.]
MRALGFCVSISRTQFMARVFNEAGRESLAVWSDTPDEERKAALQNLASSNLRVLFSVDLFNQGVDVPSVDTLLMLRPSESGTLFLQQLGRGLRHYSGKRVCTVLDFVGQHRREFRFDMRYSALLGGTRRQVQKHVENRFPFLPAECHLSLDPVASTIVLQSLK